MELKDQLNKQQLLMLRLLKNPMPEDDFNKLRRLAVKILSAQINQLVDDWEAEKGIDANYYEDLKDLNFRSQPKLL